MPFVIHVVSGSLLNAADAGEIEPATEVTAIASTSVIRAKGRVMSGPPFGGGGA